MGKIEYSESTGVRRVEYYGEFNQCITLRLTDDDDDTYFSCFWTPKMPPFEALSKLLRLGFIPLNTSRGQAEFKNSTFETRNWKDSFNRARSLPLIDLQHLELGDEDSCIVLERSPYENGLCCGMGGKLEMLPFLGTGLLLTAPQVLIIQFAAMRSRLIGSNHQAYMTTMKR